MSDESFVLGRNSVELYAESSYGATKALALTALSAMREWDTLAAFARELLDLAEKHGLLAAYRVTEPCGENCACAEYSFPTTCYRRTSLIAKDSAEA